MREADRSLLFIDVLFPHLIELTRRKGESYGTPTDVHANFRAVERADLSSTQVYILSRAVEKWARLTQLYAHSDMGNIDEEIGDLLGLLMNLWAERHRRDIHPPYAQRP